MYFWRAKLCDLLVYAFDECAGLCVCVYLRECGPEKRSKAYFNSEPRTTLKTPRCQDYCEICTQTHFANTNAHKYSQSERTRAEASRATQRSLRSDCVCVMCTWMMPSMLCANHTNLSYVCFGVCVTQQNDVRVCSVSMGWI